MSFWDDVGDVADDIGDAVSDVVDAVGGAIEDVAEWTAEALATAGTWAVEAAADSVVWSVESTLDVTDAFLTGIEESGVFDAIDVVTVGLIDVQYDDSGFSVEVGVEDVFGFGVAVGEDGLSGDVDTVVVSYSGSLGEDGFSVGGSLGVDFGPFPYAEGHASVEADGDIGVGGEVHLYLPTPAGMVGGEVEGDFQQTDDGYVLSGSVTGGYYAPTGTFVKGGVHASYEEDADGYRTNVGLHGEVGQAGVGSVKGSIDYTEGRKGDISYEGVNASGEVGGMGFAAGGEIGYQHVETPDGEYDVVSGEVYGEAGGQRATASGAIIAGPDGVEVEGDLDFQADPLGVLGTAADYAGVGAGVVPDGIDGIPGIDGLDDITGDLGLPSTDAGPSSPREMVTEAVGDAARGAFEDVVPAPAPPPPPTVETAVDDLSASFGDVVDDALDAPTDDFSE